MALEFRPPYEIDRNEKLRSLENFGNTVESAGSNWKQQAQQQQQNKIQQAMLTLHKQQAAREQEDWDRKHTGTLPGGDMASGSTDATPGGTQSWNPSPLDMGRQSFAQSPDYSPAPAQQSSQYASAGTPDTGWNTPQPSQSGAGSANMPQAMHAPGTDLSLHFNAWKQQGMGPYLHPEMSGTQSYGGGASSGSMRDRILNTPGSDNRTELMQIDKNKSEGLFRDSEIAKNQAMADFYNKKDPNKSPNSISSTTWQNATPQQQALAKALANEEIRPADIGFKEKGVILSLAKEWADTQGIPFTSYGGDVKRGMAENMAYGKGGQNVISLNTALGHASDALQAYQDVKNVDAKFLNVPINRLLSQTNDPNIVALNLNLNALQGELETVFRNGGSSEKGIESWAKYLNNGLTPTQYYAAAQKINGLLKSRIGAQQHQYSNVMDKNISGRTLISPHSEELSQKLGKAGQGGQQQFQKIMQNAAGEKVGWNGTAWVPAP